MEVGSPPGVLDKQRGVANQIHINVLLTVGTRDGQFLEQVGDAHALVVKY